MMMTVGGELIVDSVFMVAGRLRRSNEADNLLFSDLWISGWF